jgi:phospholipid/cholesterol/gamma-HCH transport system substrate-binding protein
LTDSLPPVPTGRRRDRELIVGLFVIVGIAAVFVALFTLTDASMFRRRYNVITLVPDAGGIRKGDPVLMLGVNIGRVRAFRIVPEQGVAVRLEIEGEYKLPSDSRVEIKTSGLLSGMAADVIPGSSTTFLRGGETIPGSKPAQAFDKVGDIADQTQKTLVRVQALLSQRTVENVESSSVELNGLLKQLSATTAEQRKELAALTSSLRKSAEGVEKATSGPELQNAVKRLDTVTQRLDTLTTSLDSSSRSLETVLGRIERGEGTLGRMAKDDALYVNANEAAVNLNHSLVELRDLVQDIRKQPKKYLKMSIF